MPWRAVDVHNRGLEAQMGPWMACRPVVVDSHFDEDPDTQVQSRIRIQIIVIQIRNPGKCMLKTRLQVQSTRTGKISLFNSLKRRINDNVLPTKQDCERDIMYHLFSHDIQPIYVCADGAWETNSSTNM